MTKILPLILMICLTSCLSLRVPHTEKKASKKLGKTLELVERITNQYPNLVDSVKAPIPVVIDIPQDSIEGEILPDSSKIADFFEKKYDPIVRTRDSLINVLDNNLSDYESQLSTLDQLRETNERLRNMRQSVVKEIYPDTTLTLSLNSLMVINGDSTLIQVVGIVSISESGKVSLKVNIPPQSIETEVESTTPIFKVVKSISWYVWLGVGLGLLLIILGFSRKSI